MNEFQNPFSFQNPFPGESMDDNRYEEILNLRRLLTLALRHVEDDRYEYALSTLELAVDACGRLAGSDMPWRKEQ